MVYLGKFTGWYLEREMADFFAAARSVIEGLHFLVLTQTDPHELERIFTGRVLEGDLRPSSDTPTHLELYRAWETVGGVTHTHSTWATSWAQARRPIPCLGTTHADYFAGAVPCTRALGDEECGDDYERLTGAVIVETFAELDPRELPAVLVA